MSPLHWLLTPFLTSLVLASNLLASLALASNLCNESALLSAANAYHFTNCLNVSFPSIPSKNVALVVEDSTIVALSLNTALLSLTNVTLRFMRCTIKCNFELNSAAIKNVALYFLSCQVSFDLAPLNSQHAENLFFISSPTPTNIDSFTLDVLNTSFALVATINLDSNSTGVSRNFGFLRIHQELSVRANNVRIHVADSVIALRNGNILISDDIDCDDTVPKFLFLEGYAPSTTRDRPMFTNISIVLENVTAHLQGSSVSSLVQFNSLLLVNGSVRIVDTIVAIDCYGPTSNIAMQRSATAVSLRETHFDGGAIFIANTNMSGVSVAATVARRHIATMMRGVTVAVLSIFFNPTNPSATDPQPLVRSLHIELKFCHLTSNNFGGQFSYFRGDMHSYLVGIENSVWYTTVRIEQSSVNATIRTDCPYRRTIFVQPTLPFPFANMTCIALDFLANHVYLTTPAFHVTVVVINATLTANITKPEARCAAFDDGLSFIVTSLQPPLSIPFMCQSFIAVIASSVTVVDAAALMTIMMPSFGALGPFLTNTAGAVTTASSAIVNSSIAVSSVVIALNAENRPDSAAGSTNSIQQFILVGAVGSMGGQWIRCEVYCEQAQLHTAAFLFSSAQLRDTSIIVSGESSSGALTTWLSNGTQDAVTSVYLSNVSCGAGCGTSSITVRDFPLPVDVVSRGSGGGLVALLNGSDALLSGVAWRFSDIHVRVRRRCSVPFVLFDANVATVNDPLVDVSLSCVSWNGLRTVPLVGPPLARMYQDSAVPGGCVFPAAPTFSQTFVAANSDDGADTTAVGSAAEFLAAVSVALSAIAVVGNPLDAADMQMLSALGLSMCAPKGMQASRGPMAYLLSPFVALGDRWSAGGNVLVSVAFALLHCAGTYALGTIRPTPQLKQRPGTSRLEAMAARSKWPHLSFVVSLLLTNGANFFGLSLLREHRTASDVVVGCIALLWSAAVPAAAVALVITRHPLPLGGRASSSLRLQRYVSFDVMCRGKPWAVRALLPIGFWEPEDERRRIGRLIGGVRAEWVRWGVAPQVAATALANVIAVAVPSDGDALCTAQWCLLAAVPICFACFLAVCRPTRVAAASATGASIYALMGAICIAAALESAQVATAGSVRVAVEVLSIVLAVLNGLRCLHTVSIFLLERRAAARTDSPSATSLSGVPLSSNISLSSALRSLTFSCASKWQSRGALLPPDEVANLRILIESICNLRTSPSIGSQIAMSKVKP